jgi:hypothetical protein
LLVVNVEAEGPSLKCIVPLPLESRAYRGFEDHFPTGVISLRGNQKQCEDLLTGTSGSPWWESKADPRHAEHVSGARRV